MNEKNENLNCCSTFDIAFSFFFTNIDTGRSLPIVEAVKLGKISAFLYKSVTLVCCSVLDLFIQNYLYVCK